MKPIDIILILVIAVIVFLSLRSAIKKLKSGSCCGNCSQCCGCGTDAKQNHRK